MRVRTHLRAIRQGDGRSIGDVAAITGIAKGELSSFERGHGIPRDDQLEALRNYYGHPSRWYPATVARALLPDLADCPGCGDELDPDASGARRYHDDACRRSASRRGCQSSASRGMIVRLNAKGAPPRDAPQSNRTETTNGGEYA